MRRSETFFPGARATVVALAIALGASVAAAGATGDHAFATFPDETGAVAPAATPTSAPAQGPSVDDFGWVLQTARKTLSGSAAIGLPDALERAIAVDWQGFSAIPQIAEWIRGLNLSQALLAVPSVRHALMALYVLEATLSPSKAPPSPTADAEKQKEKYFLDRLHHLLSREADAFLAETAYRKKIYDDHAWRMWNEILQEKLKAAAAPAPGSIAPAPLPVAGNAAPPPATFNPAPPPATFNPAPPPATGGPASPAAAKIYEPGVGKGAYASKDFPKIPWVSPPAVSHNTADIPPPPPEPGKAKGNGGSTFPTAIVKPPPGAAAPPPTSATSSGKQAPSEAQGKAFAPSPSPASQPKGVGTASPKVSSVPAKAAPLPSGPGIVWQSGKSFFRAPDGLLYPLSLAIGVVDGRTNYYYSRNGGASGFLVDSVGNVFQFQRLSPTTFSVGTVGPDGSARIGFIPSWTTGIATLHQQATAGFGTSFPGMQAPPEDL